MHVADDILIYSTASLAVDVVPGYPLTFIPLSDPRFSNKYMIVVNQYSITQDEYLYWQSIKKNSENNGSIFGPLPSQIKGNLYSASDESEPVIGYFSATTRPQQRIFILPTQLPYVIDYNDGYQNCHKHLVSNDSIPFFIGNTWVDEVSANGNVAGYTVTSNDCADCTIQGGTLKRPPYF